MTDIVADDPRLRARDRKTPQAWNSATKRWFLELLMDLCSVSRALATMGLAPSGLYATRKKDKKFRDAWDEAIEFGYTRLEADLLDRALNGQDREVIGRSGEKVTLRQMANALGLALLRLYAPRIAQIRALHGPEAHEDSLLAKIEIIKKLEMLARHRAKYGKPAQPPPPV
jgi:hypothetical protein